ncbi:hypothetical protein BJ508DRAFT_136488 [Ascobolus immersus RN42]|uniref:Uncharacterized protein n=1 Tax=Ascobolus immersus RN42 TaxID=1160509 RepID=A0A3N4IQZ3_ASCIM|nr:hypothetical protein BJ508DRAFT_136488 [Ascobolus immersus RN42]
MSPHAEDTSSYASPEPSHYVKKAAAVAASAPTPTGQLKVAPIADKVGDGTIRVKIKVRPNSHFRHTLLIHGNGMDLEQEAAFMKELQIACDKDNGAHNRVCALYVSSDRYPYPTPLDVCL